MMNNQRDNYNGGGDDDDDRNAAIEIAPLIIPPLRGGFFQRSMSSSSNSNNSIVAGMSNHPTPPASLGGLPRQAPENNYNNNSGGGGGRLEQLLCWIMCCCSSSSTAAAAAVPEEVILKLQTIGAFSFCLMGWYIPRFLIQRAAADIIQKSLVDFYQTTAAGDVILDSLLNQPYVEPPTIPSRLLLASSIWIPLALVLVTSVTTTAGTKSKRPLVLLHNVQAAFGGFCTAIGLSEGSTQMLKLYIQRKRPNFFALCDFDKIQKMCKAEPARILEANFSCPSGHSSLAACGMTFLALHVVAKIISLPSSSTTSSTSPVRNFSIIPGCGCSCSTMLTAIVSQRKQCSCLLVVMLASSWAMFVGASRIVDQWHHPSDVVAGVLLGCFCALVAYHVWFPPIWFMMMVQLPTTTNYTNGSSNSSSSNGTWTTVAGIPWSLATANGSAAAGANALPLVDGKLPSFHE